MKATQIFFETGERIFPDEARERAAQLLDAFQPGLVGQVMNYGPVAADGSRKTITDFPPVHFAHYPKGFSMVGYGDLGATLVADVAPPLASALQRGRKTPIQLRSRTLSEEVELKPYQLQYRVARMVVQKDIDHLAVLADPAKGKAHLERLFRASIERQAAYLGIDLPSDITVSFIGASGEFAAKNKGMARLGLRNAVFETNLCLSGLWSVGYMLSKGYGLIDANMQRGIGALAEGVIK